MDIETSSKLNQLASQTTGMNKLDYYAIRFKISVVLINCIQIKE